MRAINLIPAELRNAGGTPRRTGIAPFVLIGALALLVAMAAAYTLTTRSLGDKRAQVASIERQAAAAEAKTANLKGFSEFSQLSAQRTETVKSLAASRFDWGHALAEVARVLPHNAWLSSMRATVTPGVSVDGATDPLRQSMAVPAIELSGCTTSQENVARVVAELRRADGVRRVSLSSAVKNDASSAGATTDSSGGGTGDCTQGKSTRPKFSLTLFYDAPAAPAPPAASGTTTSGAASTAGSAAATTTGG